MACAAANVPCLGMINDRESVPSVEHISKIECESNGQCSTFSRLHRLRSVCLSTQKYKTTRQEKDNSGLGADHKKIVRLTEYESYITNFTNVLLTENVKTKWKERMIKSKRIDGIDNIDSIDRGRMFTRTDFHH